MDTIFHTASVIELLSFARPELRRTVHAINVGGAENMLALAAEAGTQRFVYTSSNNVTFDAPVIDGDETFP